MILKMLDNPEALEGYKMSTYEWANSKLNCPVCMIAEFPYLVDKGMNDDKKSTIPYADFERAGLEFNIKIYHQICESLAIAEKFDIDKSNRWYKRAVLYREHALGSFQKGEEHYEQFAGLFTTEGELYYSGVGEIELKMKPAILLLQLLKGVVGAEEVCEVALKELDGIAKEWGKVSRGKLLHTKTQVELQISMILAGISI
jgi:hypothetical protein